MLEELKHSVSIGNLSGIKHFISLMLDERITTRAAFSSLCSYIPSSELNYLAALYLFDDLQIIEFNGNKLKLTKLGNALVAEDDDERLMSIGKIAIKYVINAGLLNCSEVKYSIENRAIEIPISAFTLSSAIYRNFLLTLNVFSISQNRLSVSTIFEDHFEAFCSRTMRKVTEVDLLNRLEQQREDGKRGERFVIDYENKRLLSSGKKAKRISQIDVSAGYDILSFCNENSQEYDCFIEVKSYHGMPHFYWSENERNTSMLLKERYYLFLIDLDQISNNNYKPIIICDPSNNLSDNAWLIKAQTYYICKI